MHSRKKDGSERRLYLDKAPGVPVRNWWPDITSFGTATQSKERIGYPTQKPLALLRRIILASSNEGDLVLDPFCGCATTCVAAEELGRKWIGIDLSEKAGQLIVQRLSDAIDGGFDAKKVTLRTTLPERSTGDIPHYRTHKHVLYGEQEGVCAGCKYEFNFRNLEVDHKIPQSRGGSDHKDNLQLLCPGCNRVKGDRPMEWLVARLNEQQRVRKY